MPIGHGSLRLVDPAGHPGALPSVCIPIARPFLIHLPGALRSTGITRLHRSYGSSDSCQAGAWCLASLIASWTEPSTRSVSRHPPSSRSLGLHSTNACAAESGFLETNPPTEQGNTGVLWLHHGKVGSPERKTESSSSPTDRSFTSWCSPSPLPRGRRSARLRRPGRPPTRTFTLLIQSTHNRTAPRRAFGDSSPTGLPP